MIWRSKQGSMKMSNDTNLSKLVVTLIDSAETAKSGPLALIKKHEDEIAELHQRVQHAVASDTSVRGTIVDFFGSQPDGEKLLEAYNAAKGRTKSATDKAKSAAMRMRIESAKALLQRTCEVYDVLQRLSEQNYNWQIRTIINSTICFVHGAAERELDAKPFSVEALRRLSKQDLTGCKVVADLTSEKPKSANAEKGGNGEKIMPSKIGDTAKSLDTTLAAYDLPTWKNNGIPQMGKTALMRLYAQLERNLPRDVKIKALEEYDANAAPTIKAADAV
jgi:hypothetical protein